MGRILFIGISRSAVCHYRCRLPAEAMGADWIGVNENFGGETGNCFRLPKIDDYDTVVCQQAHGYKWEDRIDRLHRKGARVLYETDDYLHGIRGLTYHASAKHFTPALMREYDRAMAMCDEVIVSTQFLKERYRKINPHVTVCRNGIDTGRYAWRKPERGYVTVGWAGATGHDGALKRWLAGGVLDAMEAHPTSRLLVVGQPSLAGEALDRLGKYRVLGVPWGPLETYPTAMAGADVMLAPTEQDKWYRGKSDLRWLEASALGVPCICGPHIYPEAEYVASSPDDAGLLLNAFLADSCTIGPAGERAREKVLAERAFPKAVSPWRDLLAGR